MRRRHGDRPTHTASQPDQPTARLAAAMAPGALKDFSDSMTEFIEGRLRLRINRDKSAVARPEDRHFLGFRLRRDPQSGTVEVLLSERTKRNAMEHVR